MLPTGWTKCSIGDVTLPVSKINPEDDPDQEIDYIDISSIDNTRHTIGSVKQYRLRDAPSRARQIVRAGDVLFATVRPYLRNIAGVPNDYDKQIASTGFSVLRPAKGVRPAFLFYKAISKDFVNALSEIQYGVSYPAVTDDQVRGQSLWLPPMEEQHRIVAKIEELFSELDKGAESLKAARAQLITYRQAVLKHAFEGKLTARWREENKDKLETPEQLLTRIKQEWEARYEQQLKEWKTAVKGWEANGKPGKKPTRPKKATELPSRLGSEDLAKLPPSPKGHAYTHLANLGELGRGKSKHRPRNAPELFGGPYPFIQTGQVKAAGRVIREQSRTYSELGLEQSKLWPEGTLCITIAANIAETAFLGFDGCFPDSVVGFTATKTLVLPEYVELFIKSVRTRIEAYAPATAQKNINLTTLENLVVPLCSLKEQQMLVDQLEAVLSVIEEQRGVIDNQLQKTDALRQSILQTAFSGQLVAQDPRDEPASFLLDRINAEKERESKSDRSPKKTKTKRKTAA